jgi:hypothetical protein
MIIHKKLVIRRKASQTVQVRPVLVQTFRTFELLDSVAALRLCLALLHRVVRANSNVSLCKEKGISSQIPHCVRVRGLWAPVNTLNETRI